MKSLPLKLAIGLIVIFGLLFLGMLMYEPVLFKWYGWKLCSDDIIIKP